jgi:hypothetical protein
MATKVFAIDTQAGIQRDGTVFDMDFYVDGKWVRFQRGRPRKIGGCAVISNTNDAIGSVRGVWVNPNNGFNQVFLGYASVLRELTINNNGVGSGVVNITLNNFTASNNNLWQFDGFYDLYGSGVGSILAHPGQNLSQITSTNNTPVLIGNIDGTTLSQIGIFTDTNSYLNSTGTVSISQTNTLIGAGQTVTGTGIPADTTVESTVLANGILASVAVTGVAGQCSCTSTSGLFIGQTVTVSGTNTGSATGITSGTTYYIVATNYATTFTLSATLGGSGIVTGGSTTTGLVFTIGNYQKVTLSAAATTSGASTLTFNNKVSVSGGVVSLHPYIFVYGNNGLIRNCAFGNSQDWVSSDANETNVATGKIVQGLPVRGGSNAPSGLFWSLDSLIRVSYIGGSGTPPQFWRYDIISSQSSILSSQSAIEYDGVYYWCGVDRFLLYNGVVKEIPNTFNQNYFFDNLNYTQRQKVWVSKVPRYGEIWWFYPRGNATECTDAIIYNVRENCWYDAGQAIDARRSAGYFSQVFSRPIWAGWEPNVEGYVGVWQHEIGTDRVDGRNTLAIESYFETNDLGLVSGGPSQPSPVGENRWLRVDRIEPDFIQSGDMTVVVTGRPFAQSDDVQSPEYAFSPTTGKVDMREQRRELRLRFKSNVSGGNYQLGKLLLTADTGDVRPY